jgi:hypothetical protein
MASTVSSFNGFLASATSSEAIKAFETNGTRSDDASAKLRRPKVAFLPSCWLDLVLHLVARDLISTDRYDVTGVPVDRIETVLQKDWMHLIYQQRILDSPNYLKEDGRPVIALWG